MHYVLFSAIFLSFPCMSIIVVISVIITCNCRICVEHQRWICYFAWSKRHNRRDLCRAAAVDDRYSITFENPIKKVPICRLWSMRLQASRIRFIIVVRAVSSKNRWPLPQLDRAIVYRPLPTVSISLFLSLFVLLATMILFLYVRGYLARFLHNDVFTSFFPLQRGLQLEEFSVLLSFKDENSRLGR